jgi:hypothetical protein
LEVEPAEGHRRIKIREFMAAGIYGRRAPPFLLAERLAHLFGYSRPHHFRRSEVAGTKMGSLVAAERRHFENRPGGRDAAEMHVSLKWRNDVQRASWSVAIKRRLLCALYIPAFST